MADVSLMAHWDARSALLVAGMGAVLDRLVGARLCEWKGEQARHTWFTATFDEAESIEPAAQCFCTCVADDCLPGFKGWGGGDGGHETEER